MTLSDPREANAPSFLAGTARMLNDTRDVFVVWLMLQCLAVSAVGVSLFFWPYALGISVWYVAPVYWLLLTQLVMDRFTLMLHFTSHRPLFNKDVGTVDRAGPPITFVGKSAGMTKEDPNRVRQAEITQEILEVVAGAEALG